MTSLFQMSFTTKTFNRSHGVRDYIICRIDRKTLLIFCVATVECELVVVSRDLNSLYPKRDWMSLFFLTSFFLLKLYYFSYFSPSETFFTCINYQFIFPHTGLANNLTRVLEFEHRFLLLIIKFYYTFNRGERKRVKCPHTVQPAERLKAWQVVRFLISARASERRNNKD